MRRVVSWFNSLLKLLGLGLIGALLVTVRYILKIPQPLDSALLGETRLYKWKHGYIFYSLLGPSSNPPLLLLHAPEIGGSSYEMRNIAETLSQHYQVYALDLLGFGLSDHPDIPYSALTYIGLCRDFLSDVVGRPATLLASGRSCSYIVALAAQNPELCERLVLLSPASLFEQRPRPDWLARLLHRPLIVLVLYALLTTPVLLRRVHARQHNQDYNQISQNDFDHYYAATHQLGAQHAPLAALAGSLDVDVATQFEHLLQPSLVLWGLRALDSRPEIASRHSFSQQTRLILIQDAGVHVQEDRPAEVIADILAWQREGQQHEVPLTTEEERREEEPAEIVAEQPGPVIMPPFVSPEVTSQTTAVELISEKSMESATLVEDAANEQAAEVKRIEAYCVKCREKRDMQNPQSIVTKNGRNAMEGTCPVCGTRLFRFIAG